MTIKFVELTFGITGSRMKPNTKLVPKNIISTKYQEGYQITHMVPKCTNTKLNKKYQNE